jgi:hypothetical protein
MKKTIGLIIVLVSFCAHSSIGNDFSNPLLSSFSTWKKDFSLLVKNVKENHPKSYHGKVNQDNGYDTDYLFIPAKIENKNLVVLNSGIHGVEAPAGVYIQHDFLNNCLDSNFDLNYTSVLIVHVMNPYGADKGRRFNSNNVDLNRNCYVHEENEGNNFRGLTIENKLYEGLHEFFTTRIRTTAEILTKALKVGKSKAYKALSGQYTRPTGLYFGGNQTQPECRNTQDLVSSFVETHKNIFLADLHTGLGTSGINQIIHSRAKLNDSKADVLAVKKQREILMVMFPKNECKGICQFGVGKKANQNISRSYQMRSSKSGGAKGTFQVWLTTKYKKEMKDRILISVTAEIGTIAGPKALKAVINENYCHHSKEGCSKHEKLKWTERVRHAFAPSSKKKWNRQVSKVSKQMCLALSRFSKIE